MRAMHYLEKIRTREELAALCEKLKKEGKKFGFTSGVFDLLHSGHVDYLSQARAKCDLLIVGVNSDSSVKQYKGEQRPIVDQAERARVVAGLESVSFVFIFEERNNNVNVEELKPSFYFKAGDYSKSDLSSAPLVEKHGGKVELIPMQEGLSSTAIIESVIEKSLVRFHGTIEVGPPPLRPAVFIDRDGTINEHVEYLHEPEKFRIFPGVLEGLRLLQEAGFRIVIVTNQQGIGLGYFGKEDFYRVSRELLKAAGKAGVRIDKIYFCPHSLAEQCTCKKPETGLITRAVKELNVNLQESAVIGDMTADIQLARNAGCKGVLVKTGYAGEDGAFEAKPDFVAADFFQAARWITGK